MDFAIVVIGHNRHCPLNRLLLSLLKANIPFEIDLIISIDNFGTDKVNELANDFEWPYGNKYVVVHQEKLGLIKHFIWAGDQTSRYNHVIFLEDDLFVSPVAIDYCVEAARFYEKDNKVAGLCLYNPNICEFNQCAFRQIQDGYDIYFLQHPYWGNVWTKHKWAEFKEWLNSYEFNASILPLYVANWQVGSFKRIFIQYLIETDRYMVVPRNSFCINFADAGEHSSYQQYQYQNPLQISYYGGRFCSFDQSISVYDAYMELDCRIVKKMNPELEKFDFEMDLTQNKNSFVKDYVLTSRKVEGGIFEYSCQMKPLEMNLLCNNLGKGITLVKSDTIVFKKKEELFFEDIDRNYQISKKQALKFFIWSLKRSINKMVSKRSVNK